LQWLFPPMEVIKLQHPTKSSLWHSDGGLISEKSQAEVQLTLVISNSMGPWKKFESTVVRLKRRYENRKCSLFNDERETTRAKFWRTNTSIACPNSRNDLKYFSIFR
jgi:hypothetical protein